MTYTNHITDDLDVIMAVLPEDIQDAIHNIDRRDELLEVILDLYRPARVGLAILNGKIATSHHRYIAHGLY